MDRKNIDLLIRNLAFDNNPQDLKNAMSQLVNLKNDELKMLILPGVEKKTWDNAALVLKQVGYPRIKSVVFHLLDWLQDVNWPGAYTILDLLSTVDKKFLIHEIEKKISAESINDDDMWLGGIKMLSKKNNFKKDDFITKDIFEKIYSVDWC